MADCGRFVLGLLMGALLSACVEEPREDTAPPWEPEKWREQMRLHVERVELALPLITEVQAEANPLAYRDTLQIAYNVLRSVEDSFPPLPWHVGLPESELLWRYESAVRELRYGTELMLEGIARDQESQLEEARRFLALGLRHFEYAQDMMDQEPVEAKMDSAAPTHPRLSNKPHLESGPSRARAEAVHSRTDPFA